MLQFGLGFFWANGAGITKVIGTPVAAAQVVRALIGLGSEVYTGGKNCDAPIWSMDSGTIQLTMCFRLSAKSHHVNMSLWLLAAQPVSSSRLARCER
jgi:hypothetical protein